MLEYDVEDLVYNCFVVFCKELMKMKELREKDKIEAEIGFVDIGDVEIGMGMEDK